MASGQEKSIRQIFVRLHLLSERSMCKPIICSILTSVYNSSNMTATAQITTF